MGNWAGEINVPHTLAADFRLSDLDPTLFTYDTTVSHTFVFSAVAFVVFCRTKYFGTEQTIAFRLECPVVNCFWLFDFTVGPGPDHIRRGQRHADGIKAEWILWFLKQTEKIFHGSSSYTLTCFFQKLDVER